MKALSIRQPWAWAILHAGKRIENRAWKHAPRTMIGQTFLIHAAADCTKREAAESARWMAAERGLVLTLVNGSLVGGAGPLIMPSPTTMDRGALVGRARLVDGVRTEPSGHRRALPRPVCTLCGQEWKKETARCPKADPWAIPGTVGLILANVEALPAPLPFTGARGWFEVPDSVLGGLDLASGGVAAVGGGR